MITLRQLALPAITANPQNMTLYISNFNHLPGEKKKRLKGQLQEYFPFANHSEYQGMLKVVVGFPTPIHIGEYTRRLEMFFFRLRCNIESSLRFETTFCYEG